MILPGPDLERIELELALLVRRATSIASDKDDRGGLDRSGYLLLNRMKELGPIGVKSLAEALGLDNSTVSRQAASLERKGYALRRSDPSDGRAYLFEATEQGGLELADYRKSRMDRIGRRLEGWSDIDRREFGRLLRQFNLDFSG